MQREDIIKVLIFIADNYESFNEKLKDEARAKSIIDLWYSCFKDLNFQELLAGVKKTILTSKYYPTIAEVRENCYGLVVKEEETIDLWGIAYKMIGNGNYMTKEQFETYPIECQRFFGDVVALRDISKSEDLNIDVLRSNFIKVVGVLKERERKNNMLPNNLKMGAMIESLTQRMSLDKEREVKKDE